MPNLAADLARLLDGIERPGDFSVGGLCDLLAPHLEIDGVGTVALPLLPIQAEQIVAVAERAPFGRGEQTLVDTSVRRTWQIGTGLVSIAGAGWARTLAGIVESAAEGLGVDGPVRAEFYKLLVYDVGGFFAGHRDTEKVPGMFATLVIVLPSPGSGGELVVRHAGQEVSYVMRPPEPSQAAFAAFYADCLHEVLPVTSGWRLTLVYNLVRAAPGGTLRAPDHGPERLGLTKRLGRWDGDAPAKLVVPLAHAYTPAGLSFDALKGIDAARAAVLAEAAATADCDLYLGLLTIKESGSAEEMGGWGYGRRGSYDEDAFEVVEVLDREVVLSDWQRLDGTPASLGPLPVEDGEVTPADALDNLAPDDQSFREATGNEGASFERTYRHVALVVWPKANRLAVINQGGLAATLPLLADYAERWVAEAGGDRASPAWGEAHALSGHMLASWSLGRRGYGPASDKAVTLLGSLCHLRDVERVEQALGQIVASGFYFAGQAPEILASLRLLPRERIASVLEAVVAGNAGIAFADAADLLKAAAKPGVLDIEPGALRPAAHALLAAMPDPSMATAEHSWSGGPRKVGSGAVADGLAAIERIDVGLARKAVDIMLTHPILYGLDDAVIPALLELGDEGATDARERLRSVSLAHLERRIAEPLVEPVDWRRDATLICDCRLCADLGRFLADPKREAWTLKASEHDRSHVENTVRNSGSDLACKTLKQGRPYTLVCVKTDASYRLRVGQRERDLAARARLSGTSA
ncbi:2OG-Fe(II) oxygenase [Lichenibacterium dinghuense]|uniref:2OG-Fe(II) oxygenase n=1 Tax=Lichenibacterium dinghuense TaxID=2895977 RepID=UPI001F2FD9A0|nr:2OG-Fe(II) oxygenase [Lichenibacterium sp. 6Y81]